MRATHTHTGHPPPAGTVFCVRDCVFQNAMLKIAHHSLWFTVMKEIINLSQKVTQAVWGKHADLLQLPNFSEGNNAFALANQTWYSGFIDVQRPPRCVVSLERPARS